MRLMTSPASRELSVRGRRIKKVLKSSGLIFLLYKGWNWKHKPHLNDLKNLNLLNTSKIHIIFLF